jgi:hypothetical protein
MRLKTNRRRALGIEVLEARELMAGDVAVIFGRGTVYIDGPQKSVDLQITDSNGLWKIEGLNGTTVNGSQYTTVSPIWTPNLSINLDGVSGSYGSTWGSNLRIVGINVPGSLTVNMSTSHDVVQISRSTVGNNVTINTLQGDDEINLGHKNLAFVGNFNTIGRDLTISSGNGYDTVKFIGDNLVKDDVLINAGDVGPVGSAEFLTISGLTVGGFGVDNNLNHLTIEAASHVDLDLRKTTVESDLVISATASGCWLEMNDLDVGRDLKIQTGDNRDTINVMYTNVGRDLVIYSDNQDTPASGEDYIYIVWTIVDRNGTIDTDSSGGNGARDSVFMQNVIFEEDLFIEMGAGDWDSLDLFGVYAEGAYLDGGSGQNDNLRLKQCVFSDWMDLENFEDVTFD